jgi:hypothetical protein
MNNLRRITLSTLLLLLLLGLRPGVAFGQDRAAVQRALDTGSVVDLNGKTIRVDSALVLRNRGTLKNGVIESSAGEFAVVFDGNGSDQTLQSVTLRGAGVGLIGGAQYTRPSILDCRVEAARATGIKITVLSREAKIERNYIADNPRQYGLIAFHLRRASVRFNHFHNVNQGAHLLSPSEHTHFSDNRGTKLREFLIEAQRLGDFICQDVYFERNVATDWLDRMNDSAWGSICLDEGTRIWVRDNYSHADPRTPWNRYQYPDGSWSLDRWGINEFSFDTGEVANNVFVGDYWYHLMVAGAGGRNKTPMVLRDNKLYGRPSGGSYIGTESPPVKAPLDINNLKDPNSAHAPPPPGNTPPATQPAPGGTWPANLRTTRVDRTNITVAWEPLADPNLVGYVVWAKPREQTDWRQFVMGKGETSLQFQPNPGWEYWMSVEATTDTRIVQSNVIHVKAERDPPGTQPATQPAMKKVRIHVDADPGVEVEVIRK